MEIVFLKRWLALRTQHEKRITQFKSSRFEQVILFPLFANKKRGMKTGLYPTEKKSTKPANFFPRDKAQNNE